MLARLSLLGVTRQARRRRWIKSSEGFFVVVRSASSSSSNHSPPPSSSPSFPFAPRDDPVAIPKLLISNRGEIACRIIHTARRLGVPTVAVFSDADAGAPHVSLADEAVRLGPPPPSSSYLDVGRILAAAEATGATAVHPGYGFLSESAPFAEKILEKGITWVGPPPAAMRSMGDKARAKELMSEAGVPVVPGYHGEDQSDERLCAEAERVGFPILIKAVLGGGGKGMKIARNSAEVPAAVGAARREAAASFGDDRLLLERLVARPRHLEVQVMADAHGSVVHLGERDCSVQRRHQKVIEEAPGPGVSQQFRAALGAAAVAAAEAVGYEGAGTVEFIVGEKKKGSSSAALPEFFFMEMNTRLQVEHPVTEAAIAGYPDLVEWQLRVAAGERLPSSAAAAVGGGGRDTKGVPLSGSVAVEARLYAERPEAGFLPAAGVLSAWRPPRGALEFRWPGFQREEEGEGSEQKKKKRSSSSPSSSSSSDSNSNSSVSRRADAGISGPGDAVGVHYDPMIAKILAKGPTRDAALEELARALEDMRVGGISTNAGLLWRLSKSPEFRRANGLDEPGSVSLDTHFLETHAAKLLRAPRPSGKLLALAVAAVHAAGATSTAEKSRRGTMIERRRGGAWSSSDGARPGSGLPARRSLTFSHEASGSSVEASLEQTSEGGGKGGGVGVLKITTTTTKSAAAEGEEEEGEKASSISAEAASPETSTTTLRDVQLHPPGAAAAAAASENSDDGVWTVTALDAESGARLSADVAFGSGSGSVGGGSDSDVVVVDLWPASSSSETSPLLGPLTEPCVSLHLPVARHWASPEDLSGENRGAALSPMPGKVARVAVAVGDKVKKGDTLCLLEAMKMEHPVRSPIDGVVKELDAAPGALVGGGERLALIVVAEEEEGGEKKK